MPLLSKAPPFIPPEKATQVYPPGVFQTLTGTRVPKSGAAENKTDFALETVCFSKENASPQEIGLSWILTPLRADPPPGPW